MKPVTRIIRDGEDAEWRPFPGHEDAFEVSRCGRVRSVSRYVNSPIAGGKRWHKGRECKLIYSKGYSCVRRLVEGVQKSLLVHRGVAGAFIPNPCGKPDVNHIDGNPSNNEAKNLEWVTHKENMAHARATGLIRLDASAKLSPKQVHQIRRKLAEGVDDKSLAARYDVTAQSIKNIRLGRTWKHL